MDNWYKQYKEASWKDVVAPAALGLGMMMSPMDAPASENQTGEQEMAEALGHLLDKKAEYDKARDEYDGYSWDYAYGSLIDELEQAKKDVNQAIDQTIKRGVAAAMLEVLKGISEGKTEDEILKDMAE